MKTFVVVMGLLCLALLGHIIYRINGNQLPSLTAPVVSAPAAPLPLTCLTYACDWHELPDGGAPEAPAPKCPATYGARKIETPGQGAIFISCACCK